MDFRLFSIFREEIRKLHSSFFQIQNPCLHFRLKFSFDMKKTKRPLGLRQERDSGVGELALSSDGTFPPYHVIHNKAPDRRTCAPPQPGFTLLKYLHSM